ncbi:MAG TPA: FtsX-like permease family protein [Nocardioides sp.]|uniref:ABC transporter permease n=1 Tax=Nocardioides sp. TaxID=35761 RepID=UPI002EDB15CF
MLKLTLRNLLARKVRLLMSGLAIVLGVAFLSGVLVFSNGLSATFDSIVKGTTADGLVRVEGAESFTAGEAGVSSATLGPEDVAALAALPEVARADGNVDGFGMNLLDTDGSVVGGTGAPTLAFNHTAAPNMAGEQILVLQDGRWPEQPDEIALDEGAAERGGYEIGDEVGLLAPYGELERTATLVGTAEFNGGGTAGSTLLIFDTAGAQQIFLGGQDAFTTVSLTAADGVSQEELAEAAAAVLPDGFEAATGDTVVEESESAINEFLGVISVFLLVFAIIAVVIGGFIIVNTFTILVAQRTRELALLRALGASRRQVTRSVLVEAAVMAVVAATVGIGLGWLLARGLAALFRSVGLDIASSQLVLTPRTIVVSYLVGVVVTVLAAYLPARRAGKVAPVTAMRGESAGARGSLRRRTLIGSVVLLLGAGLAVAGLLDAPGSDAAWVGAGALLWVLTLAAISSVAGRPVLLACRAIFGRLFGTTGRLAGENALRDPRRTGATASALMIGLALVSTIGVLAASMNKTVDDIVDEQFTSDFLVQSTNFMPFPTGVGDALEHVDGVGTVARQQWASALLLDDAEKGPGETTYVAGNDATFDDIYSLEMVEGEQRLSGDTALVDADLAKERGWTVGDAFTLGFPAGRTLDLTVGGIYEPTEVTGAISLPLERLAEAGINRQDTSISIDLAPGADATAVHEALDAAVEDAKIIAVYDREEFAESIRGQVNQLLYMIYGLLALAIVIAVIGIVNTLGLSVIERTREIGLLRAIGMSRARLRRMVTLESVAIAVLGAVMGMVVGVVIGVMLQRTLADQLTTLGLPLGQLVAFLVIAVVVGVLAAVLPAVRAARLNVLQAIATE